MKAEAINLLIHTSTPELKLTHGNESPVTFSIASFGRNNFRQEFDIFDHINRYWATLPETRQQEIFEVYKQLNQTFASYSFSTGKHLTDLGQSLAKLSEQLLNLHDFEDLHNWIIFKSDIIIPSGFEASYIVSVDKQGNREQTYLRSDYTKLVALSIILRAVIPVWGEYISNTRQETGTTLKEYYALNLIKKAEIFHNEAFEKLRVYIDHTVGTDRYNASRIVDGISSEDFPTWILGLVCVRRLCIADNRGIDPRANAVTYIHKFIIHKSKGSDNAFEDTVKEKDVETPGNDIETKLSSLERYKVKQDISIGEIVELQYLLRDPVKVAFRLSSLMTDDIIRRSLATSQLLLTRRLLDPQVTLLRWVLKPVIPPRVVMYVSKESVVNALGVAQAVLWARGHKYLAALITSYANVADGELFVSGVDSKARLTKEIQAELDKVFPYQKISGGKKSGPKQTNLAVRSIDSVSDGLNMFSWRATADEKFLSEVLQNPSSRRIQIAYDIKLQLAKLVIELGSRSWL